MTMHGPESSHGEIRHLKQRNRRMEGPATPIEIQLIKTIPKAKDFPDDREMRTTLDLFHSLETDEKAAVLRLTGITGGSVFGIQAESRGKLMDAIANVKFGVVGKTRGARSNVRPNPFGGRG